MKHVKDVATSSLMSDVEDEVRSTWAVKASLIPSSGSTVPLIRQANDAEELIYLRCDAFRKKY